MRALHTIVWVGLCVFLCIACESDGGETSSDVTADGPDVGPVIDVVHDPDVATQQDVASDPDVRDEEEDVPGDQDVAEELVPSGGVVVWQAESMYLDRANAQAGFQWFVESAPPEVMFGSCAIVAVDPDATSTPSSLDAGTIAVTGTVYDVNLTFDSALPDGGFGYVSNLADDNERLHPDAGALVTVSASGGADLPGFTIEANTPTPVSISEPDGGLMDSVDGDEALLVAWNAAIANTVVVTVSALDAQGSPIAGDSVVCTLDGDPGEYTVPVEAMAYLPSSPGGRVLVSVTRIITVVEPLLDGEVTLGVTASSGVAPRLN